MKRYAPNFKLPNLFRFWKVSSIKIQKSKSFAKFRDNGEFPANWMMIGIKFKSSKSYVQGVFYLNSHFWWIFIFVGVQIKILAKIPKKFKFFKERFYWKELIPNKSNLYQKRDGPHSAGYSFSSFGTFSITRSAGYFLFSSSVSIEGIPFEHISIRFIINLFWTIIKWTLPVTHPRPSYFPNMGYSENFNSTCPDLGCGRSSNLESIGIWQ